MSPSSGQPLEPDQGMRSVRDLGLGFCVREKRKGKGDEAVMYWMVSAESNPSQKSRTQFEKVRSIETVGEPRHEDKIWEWDDSRR